MRTLAIDLGAARIGLALSDAGGKWATPHDVIPAAHAIDSILKLIREEEVKRLVIGLPLNMDGTTGPAAKSTIEWANNLAKQTKLEVIFVDERLSSFTAEEQLTARKRAGEKLTHKKKKQQQDALAAAGFLQEFLDGKLPALEV